MERNEYKQDTIKKVRLFQSRLNSLDNVEIANLYQEWSELHYCAGWIESSEGRHSEFIEWATIAPCDRQKAD